MMVWIFWINILVMLITVSYGQSTSGSSPVIAPALTVSSSTEKVLRTTGAASTKRTFSSLPVSSSPYNLVTSAVGKDLSNVTIVHLLPSQSVPLTTYLHSKTTSLAKPSLSTSEQLVSVISSVTSGLKKMSTQMVILPSSIPPSTPTVTSPSSVSSSFLLVLHSTEVATKPSSSQMLNPLPTAAPPPPPAESSSVAQTSIVQESVNTTMPDTSTLRPASVTTTYMTSVLISNTSQVLIVPETSAGIKKSTVISPSVGNATPSSVFAVDATAKSVMMNVTRVLLTSVSLVNSTSQLVSVNTSRTSVLTVNTTMSSVLVDSTTVLVETRESIFRESTRSVAKLNTTLTSAVMKTVVVEPTFLSVVNGTGNSVTISSISAISGTVNTTLTGRISATSVTANITVTSMLMKTTSRTSSITLPVSITSSVISHFVVKSSTPTSKAISLGSSLNASLLLTVKNQYRIVIEADCKEVPAIQSIAFKEAVITAISNSLGIDTSQIKILKVSCGSINVDVEIKHPAKDNITERLRRAVAEKQITINYNSKRLTVLSVLPIPSTDDGDDDTVYIIYIVLGTVIGIAFLIGLVALIIKCRHERTAGLIHVPSEGQLELSRFSGSSKAYFRQGNFYGGLEGEYSEPEFGNGNNEPNTVFYGDTVLEARAENGETRFSGADEGYVPEWKTLPTLDLSEAGHGEGGSSAGNILLTYGSKNSEREQDLVKPKNYVNSYDNPSMDTEDRS